MTAVSSSFNLRELIYALSDALGLVGVDDIHHGKRVGYMAYLVAKEIDVPAMDPEFMFDLGVLHDIGVSSTKVFKHLVGEFEWENRDQHCEIGYHRLHRFQPLKKFADAVRYHHTRWSDLDQRLKDTPSGLQANLIYLVDRVDALAASHYQNQNLLSAVDGIRQTIEERSGDYFNPILVSAFLRASRHEAFWLGLDDRSLRFFEQERLAERESCDIAVEELKGLAEVFSEIVDAKSVFTAEHSKGVASVAAFLGDKLGLSADRIQKLEVAGLLHDIGKLRIPDEILDKPGPLTPFERSIMNMHSYETFQILRQIKGLEDITQWAAYHHEEPSASGYPFGLEASELPIEAKILRIADILQAVLQDRPYRSGMTESETRSLLESLESKGKLDKLVLSKAIQWLEKIIPIARGNSPKPNQVKMM